MSIARSEKDRPFLRFTTLTPSIRAIVSSEAVNFTIALAALDECSDTFRKRIQIQEHSNDTILDFLDISIDLFEVFVLNTQSRTTTITRTAACNKLTLCPVCGKRTVDWSEPFLVELCIFAFETGIEYFVNLVWFELTKYYGPLRLPTQPGLELAKSKNTAIHFLLLSYWIQEMEDSGVEDTMTRLDGWVLDDVYLWWDRIGKSDVEENLQEAMSLLRTMYNAIAGRWENWREEECVHQK